jgi:hypothetical protein
MNHPRGTTKLSLKTLRRFSAAMGLLRVVLAGVATIGLVASHAQAQRSRIREGGYAPRFAPPTMPDRAFSFCRVMYQSVRSEPMGMGWRTDYPYADVNFMIRLAELTRTPISKDSAGEPNHYVVKLTDDALFNCPFIMASDVGTIGLSNEEAARLRTYLLKGGFFWVDDFWGTLAWDQWTTEISKVLPPAKYPIVDVPPSDPILSSLYRMPKVPQITNIQFWRRVGGSTTSERGTDSAEPHFRAIRDTDGRIMVLMTHNTDIGDAWEREGEDYDFFERFSPGGYALGIDVLVHAMTH